MLHSISIEHLHKWFGGTHALNDVSFRCRAGDIHAIAGENGAGKSTLVKVISGVIPTGAYEGAIEIGGQKVSFAGVREAEHAGIFLVPQELNVIPELSIADNLFLNRELRRWGMVDHAALWAATRVWLEAFQLDVSPLTPIGELSSHQQQLVSIARAMTQGVKVLILDEPTASLTDRETELLFSRMRVLREHGVTTLYISHRLAELQRIADVVTVLRDGKIVDDFRMSDVEDAPRRIVHGMIGQDVDNMYPKRSAVGDEMALELHNWTVQHTVAGRPPVVKGIDLNIRSGEVLGMFGLIGSGAYELARSLFGATNGARSGTAQIYGKSVTLSNPQVASSVGIAYLPSDRKRDGLVPDMSVAGNLTLAALVNFGRFGLVRAHDEMHSVRDYVQHLRIKCASVDQPVSGLSGGNQQKVMAGRWLMSDPRLFIMDEPTRGVDVGARLEIYELINEIAARGCAILLVSTDASEILGMSDQVMVMREGRIAGQWQRGDVGEEDLMLYAGGNPEAAHA